jgi:hypothetical protein
MAKKQANGRETLFAYARYDRNLRPKFRRTAHASRTDKKIRAKNPAFFASRADSGIDLFSRHVRCNFFNSIGDLNHGRKEKNQGQETRTEVETGQVQPVL